MTPTDDLLQRFGRIVKERRDALGLRQDQMVHRGGPSTTTMTKVENGTLPTPSPVTLRKLDKGLGWADGSAALTLAGGEPTPLRLIDIHMPSTNPKTSMIQASEKSWRRAKLDPGREAELQTALYEGITNSWEIADIARELGCPEESVSAFVNSGFGLLLNSGTLSLLAHEDKALAELIAKFATAEGAAQAQGSGQSQTQSSVTSLPRKGRIPPPAGGHAAAYRGDDKPTDHDRNAGPDHTQAPPPPDDDHIP